MDELIVALYDVLNMLKGFTAGYSTETFGDGKMLIEHKGVRYFLKVEKVEHPETEITKDIQKLRYWS